MIAYILSLVLSATALILSMIFMLVEPESSLFKYVGDTELYVMMGASIIFLIVGLFTGGYNDGETEE